MILKKKADGMIAISLIIIDININNRIMSGYNVILKYPNTYCNIPRQKAGGIQFIGES
jgi:hypothetical protein